jgi:hypothetical protein
MSPSAPSTWHTWSSVNSLATNSCHSQEDGTVAQQQGDHTMYACHQLPANVLVPGEIIHLRPVPSTNILQTSHRCSPGQRTFFVGMSTPYTLGWRTGGAAEARYTLAAPALRTMDTIWDMVVPAGRWAGGEHHPSCTWVLGGIHQGVTLLCNQAHST